MLSNMGTTPWSVNTARTVNLVNTAVAPRMGRIHSTRRIYCIYNRSAIMAAVRESAQ